jgi:predicted RNA-binding protein with PIN domain
MMHILIWLISLLSFLCVKKVTSLPLTSTRCTVLNQHDCISRGSFPIMATKKKKKKDADAAAAVNSLVSSKAAAPETRRPMRVDNNINVPVRQQIAWAKAYKRIMSTSFSSTTQVTKKFRQDRGPKEEEEEYTEIDFKQTKPPAVFVDGYNVIGYINSVEGRNIAFDDARDCLISDLAVLRSATGWWIEVVFDAYKAMMPQKSESVDSLLVTYTGMSETADNYIERRFGELSAEGFTNMIVATDDMVLRMVASGASAGYLTCSMLVEELRIAYRGWENMEVEMEREAKRQRPSIGDGLSETHPLKRAMAQMKIERAEAEAEAAAAAR